MARTLDRRTFLKASGVAMALPLLETMSFANAPRPPARLVAIGATLGLYADSWFPKTAGADYEPSEYLALIDAYRDRYTLFSGLAHANQSGRQAHNSEITWLTSVEHPGLDGFQNTVSLDQAAADHIGYATRYPSIVLGTNTPQSQSYTTSGVMVPAETSPAALFTKLFLQGDPEAVRRERQRLDDGGSILDHLQAQTAALRRQASAADRSKLDAYYQAVRTAEKDLVAARAWLDRPKPAVDAELPQDFQDPADLIGRLNLWFDLIPLILETDSSRVVSVMIQDHGAVPKVAGVSGEHHGLSHHGQDPRQDRAAAQDRNRNRQAVRPVARAPGPTRRQRPRPPGHHQRAVRQQPGQRQLAQRHAPAHPRRRGAFPARPAHRPRRRGRRAALKSIPDAAVRDGARNRRLRAQHQCDRLELTRRGLRALRRERPRH